MDCCGSSALVSSCSPGKRYCVYMNTFDRCDLYAGKCMSGTSRVPTIIQRTLRIAISHADQKESDAFGM
eukprot:scaffold138724_cov23-Prasinocladus_malaysianus.AAC.1